MRSNLKYLTTKKESKVNTNIYAITDSHQESRNLSQLLSGIYNFEKTNQNPFLILDSGDLFKGIYDKELSVNAYIKIKELLPQAQIFITIGNNDFGFKKADFEYLKSTVKRFYSAGINVVCANIIDDKTNQNIDWIDKYKIITINNQRVLITGFCLNNSCAKKFNCHMLSLTDGLEKVLENLKEPYDKLIILNHHWYPESKILYDWAKAKNKTPTLIIGGHEHSKIQPDYENNIYYPYSFARSMYKIKMDKKIDSVEEIPVEKCRFIPELETPILKYEQITKLKEPITKRVIDLPKKYSEACPLGTFISDCMKKIGNTDIAFHSTGFSMYPLKLEDSDIITKYDLLKVMCASSTIEKIEISTAQLKETFENTAKNRMLKDRGNAKFLQCSQNIKITGHGNPQTGEYKILQITINGEDLLDKNQNPIDPNRKFTCTIDPYIGSGEQEFSVLKNIPKTKVLQYGKEVPINELFAKSLIEASKTTSTPYTYPSFKYIDV